MATIKRKLIANAKNILSGARVKKKIVVFESDDWGSQRLSGADALKGLLREELLENPCKNDQVDTIARPEDLSILFGLLSSYKGRDGECAKLTPYFNPVNPDFTRIKESGYQEYYYETFIDILDREGVGGTVKQMWNSALGEHIVSPQYHGREHLTFPVWMEALRSNESNARKSFEYHYYASSDLSLPPKASKFLSSMFFRNEMQKKQIADALVDGINIMGDIFSQKPSVFAPPNGVSHPYFDLVLAEKGIKAVHNPNRWEPDGNGNVYQAKSHGCYNSCGQLIYARNCVFEPVDVSYDAVDYCLTQIQGAFNWHKAAIISTHRLNYVGGIEKDNREKGIRELDRLLKAICSNWPDVQFMTTDQYINLVKESENE